MEKQIRNTKIRFWILILLILIFTVGINSFVALKYRDNKNQYADLVRRSDFNEKKIKKQTVLIDNLKNKLDEINKMNSKKEEIINLYKENQELRYTIDTYNDTINTEIESLEQINDDIKYYESELEYYENN